MPSFKLRFRRGAVAATGMFSFVAVFTFMVGLTSLFVVSNQVLDVPIPLIGQSAGTITITVGDFYADQITDGEVSANGDCASRWHGPYVKGTVTNDLNVNAIGLYNFDKSTIGITSYNWCIPRRSFRETGDIFEWVDAWSYKFLGVGRKYRVVALRDGNCGDYNPENILAEKILTVVPICGDCYTTPDYSNPTGPWETDEPPSEYDVLDPIEYIDEECDYGYGNLSADLSAVIGSYDPILGGAHPLDNMSDEDKLKLRDNHCTSDCKLTQCSDGKDNDGNLAIDCGNWDYTQTQDRGCTYQGICYRGLDREGGCICEEWDEGCECGFTSGDDDDPCEGMNCNDGNACTTDSCSEGSCVNTPINCNDGNSCTTDSCSNGSCVNTQKNCDDGNACTSDSCSGGSCINTPINCDDGDECTSDSCSGGSCVNTAIDCGEEEEEEEEEESSGKYEGLKRPALLHHVKNHGLRTKRNTPEPVLIKIIEAADRADWGSIQTLYKSYIRGYPEGREPSPDSKTPASTKVKSIDVIGLIEASNGALEWKITKKGIKKLDIPDEEKTILKDLVACNTVDAVQEALSEQYGEGAAKRLMTGWDDFPSILTVLRASDFLA